jgi:mycofactocin precursor
MDDTLTATEVEARDDEQYRVDEQFAEDELLVEEISIDGMCGVY